MDYVIEADHGRPQQARCRLTYRQRGGTCRPSRGQTTKTTRPPQPSTRDFPSAKLGALDVGEQIAFPDDWNKCGVRHMSSAPSGPSTRDHRKP